MINAPLQKVRTLACLAETGSFRGAAERLGISQPAVSAHIRELEALYGVALVNRTTRRVALTPDGKVFAAHALRALAELDNACRDLHARGAAQRGLVTVACIPPLIASIVPPIVGALKRTHPAVEVRLIDVPSTQLDATVMQGDADFGIGPRIGPAETAFERLMREDFVAAVSRRHPLANRGEIALADLAPYPFVSTTRNANARKLVDKAFARLRLSVQTRFEFVHYLSIVRFVEADLGVAVMPRLVFMGAASESSVPLEIRSPRIWRDLGVIRRKAYQLSPAARAFVAALRQAFAEIGRAPAPAAGRSAALRQAASSASQRSA